MEPHRIYLDYAASTPLDPRVLAVFTATAALAGNPSSVHSEGRALRSVIDRARRQVGDWLGAPEEEIVFVSGASEANAAAIRGVLRAVRRAHPSRQLRAAVAVSEHASVIGSVRNAEEDGECVTDWILPGPDGSVNAGAVRAAIGVDTALVAVQAVNNVIGSVNDVPSIGEAVRAERRRRLAAGDPLPIVFLCDAVQAARTGDMAALTAATDILTVSAHKIYGPKGVGALRLARSVPFTPYAGGGGHETGRRHGTENVAGIAAFGEAASIMVAERSADADNASELRKEIARSLAERDMGFSVVGGAGAPDIVFLRHRRARGDEIALRLDMAGIAVSSGSACDAGHRKSPAILTALLDEQAALQGGIRVSFGRGTTAQDIQALIDALAALRI